MFKRFFKLEWKQYFRSSHWQKGLALKIIMGFFVLYFLVTFLAIGIGSPFTSPGSINLISNQVNIENYGCHYGQCHATAKSTGERCKHCVSNEGDSYCWQHD